MSEEEGVALLLDDRSEEGSSDVDTSNVCQQRPQRSLPPGKKYHLFISYSSHDKTYVLGLKNVLEGLGFKCMLADQDFSYGVSVMQNIETTIQTSHKQLLVVSQHFLKSCMCDKEVDMAHKYAADIGRKDFMIVLRLDESSKLPLKLNYLTYINGVGLEVKDVGCEIDKRFDFCDADVPPAENTNGEEIVRKTPSQKTSGLCCNSSYAFSGLSEFERNKLLSKAMEVMGKLCSIVRRNTDCKTQNYIVIPRRNSHRLSISIISYDMKPCWNFLEQRAREHWPQDSEESIYNKCNEEMIKTIIRWLTASDLNSIPQVESIRHRTYQNRRCLCQLAKSPWTFKQSGQIMEDSQSEETCLMEIAGSDKAHETYVKEVYTNNVDSKKGNNETHVIDIYNRQEDISSYSHGTRAVGGSPIHESSSTLSLKGAEGGTSLTETASTSLFDYDIDEWCGDMCETRVRGESTSTKQPQVSYELATLVDYPMTKKDLEMSTSFEASEQAKTIQSGDEEVGYFRGEYVIDEETHVKVPK